MILTDVFSEIGTQHKICEDYIISGMLPYPYIILADGCSSSSNTEMGSRILCHLAKQYLRYRVDDLHDLDYKTMGRWIIHNAEMTARQLGLNLTCLDATLIIAYVIDGLIKVYMYGDGAIFIKGGDVINSIKVDFSGNAPYYLSYLIDDYRNELYYEAKHDMIIDRTLKGTPETYAYDYKLEFEFYIKDIDCLMLASDGIYTFITKPPEVYRIIPAEDILPDFMTFKTTKGEYLKRRLNKALKELNKNHINHYDDLSVGSFMSVEG